MAKATTTKRTTKTATAKKATKATKATKGTKAAKATKAKPANGKANGITGNQTKVLQALKSGKEMSRKDLSAKTGIARGWSKILGASTLDGFGASSDGLEPKGLVKSLNVEGVRGLTYKITPAGKKLVS